MALDVKLITGRRFWGSKFLPVALMRVRNFACGASDSETFFFTLKMGVRVAPPNQNPGYATE